MELTNDLPLLQWHTYDLGSRLSFYYPRLPSRCVCPHGRWWAQRHRRCIIGWSKEKKAGPSESQSSVTQLRFCASWMACVIGGKVDRGHRRRPLFFNQHCSVKFMMGVSTLFVPVSLIFVIEAVVVVSYSWFHTDKRRHKGLAPRTTTT